MEQECSTLRDGTTSRKCNPTCRPPNKKTKANHSTWSDPDEVDGKVDWVSRRLRECGGGPVSERCSLSVHETKGLGTYLERLFQSQKKENASERACRRCKAGSCPESATSVARAPRPDDPIGAIMRIVCVEVCAKAWVGQRRSQTQTAIVRDRTSTVSSLSLLPHAHLTIAPMPRPPLSLPPPPSLFHPHSPPPAGRSRTRKYEAGASTEFQTESIPAAGQNHISSLRCRLQC